MNATAETEKTWKCVIVKDGRESRLRVFAFDYFAARKKIEARYPQYMIRDLALIAD